MRKLLKCVLLLLFTTSLSAQVGETAADFTVTDVKGKTHNLYSYLESGKYVLIDFFYTTCGPCQYYAPQVNLAYEKYGCNSGDIIFITIDHDDTDEEVKAYDEEYEIEFPSISGKDGGGNAVVSAYGINAFPTFYVINPEKKIATVVSPPTVLVFSHEFSQLGIKESDCTTGISAMSQQEAVSIYPNPAHDQLNIELPGSTGHLLIEVMDITGKVLLSKRVENNTQTTQVNIGSLPKGQYLLRIRTLDGLINRRIFIR